MGDSEELKTLKEIRDAIQKHQEYIEERDKWMSKATQKQIEEYQKQNEIYQHAKSNSKYAYAIYIGMMMGLYLIAMALYFR